MQSSSNENYIAHEAARDGKTSILESILQTNPQLAAKKDLDDRLPLHLACSHNQLEAVTLLAERRDFDPDAKDGAGWTPLMYAASLKEGEPLVALLLQKGADPNAKNDAGQVTVMRQDTFGMVNTKISSKTALHFCASKNNLDIARQLIAHKATTRVKDKRGQILPIHRAASIGSVPMVKLLLDNNSPLNATDVSGMTALHHAIAEGNGDTAVYLLKAGAETDKRDNDDHLAIDLAPDEKVRRYVLQSAAYEGIDLKST